MYVQPGSDEHMQARDELKELLTNEIELYKQQKARRARITMLAKAVYAAETKSHAGVKDLFYLGPDVDNLKFILVFGMNANVPLKQMETLGYRVSLATKRKNPNLAKRNNAVLKALQSDQ